MSFFLTEFIHRSPGQKNTNKTLFTHSTQIHNNCGILGCFTCPVFTAECCPEQVKITMVTNFTNSATVLNLCGIPENQREVNALLRRLFLNNHITMVHKCAQLLSKTFSFSLAHLLMIGNEIHIQRFLKSNPAVFRQPQHDHHSCSGS